MPKLDSQEQRELVLAFADGPFQSCWPVQPETVGARIVGNCDGNLPKYAELAYLEPQ